MINYSATVVNTLIPSVSLKPISVDFDSVLCMLALSAVLIFAIIVVC